MNHANERVTNGRFARIGAVLAALTVGVFTLAPLSARAQTSCPADPVLELQNINAQVDALLVQMKTLKKTATKEAKDALKTGGEGAAALKIRELEETVFQIDEQVTSFLATVIEINRCCFRSGKFLTWLEVERITVLFKKTITLIIKYERIIIHKFYKIKLKIQKITTNVNCCQCDGVLPPITGCASTVGLQLGQCDIACLPFNWTGGYFTSSMCDAFTGICVPDP